VMYHKKWDKGHTVDVQMGHRLTCTKKWWRDKNDSRTRERPNQKKIRF